jgi:hypothetical protein
MIYLFGSKHVLTNKTVSQMRFGKTNKLRAIKTCNFMLFWLMLQPQNCDVKGTICVRVLNCIQF